MKENTSESACSAEPTLIFPCSGGSDIGEISDRIARLLSGEGFWNMSCLAAVGARL